MERGREVKYDARRQGRAMVTKCRVEALSVMLRVYSAMPSSLFVDCWRGLFAKFYIDRASRYNSC